MTASSDLVPPSKEKLGVGISWDPKRGGKHYKARVYVRGKEINVGRFKTILEAQLAHDQAVSLLPVNEQRRRNFPAGGGNNSSYWDPQVERRVLRFLALNPSKARTAPGSHRDEATTGTTAAQTPKPRFTRQAEAPAEALARQQQLLLPAAGAAGVRTAHMGSTAGAAPTAAVPARITPLAVAGISSHSCLLPPPTPGNCTIAPDPLRALVPPDPVSSSDAALTVDGLPAEHWEQLTGAAQQEQQSTSSSSHQQQQQVGHFVFYNHLNQPLNHHQQQAGGNSQRSSNLSVPPPGNQQLQLVAQLREILQVRQQAASLLQPPRLIPMLHQHQRPLLQPPQAVYQQQQRQHQQTYAFQQQQQQPVVQQQQQHVDRQCPVVLQQQAAVQQQQQQQPGPAQRRQPSDQQVKEVLQLVMRLVNH